MTCVEVGRAEGYKKEGGSEVGDEISPKKGMGAPAGPGRKLRFFLTLDHRFMPSFAWYLLKQ